MKSIQVIFTLSILLLLGACSNSSENPKASEKTGNEQEAGESNLKREATSANLEEENTSIESGDPISSIRSEFSRIELALSELEQVQFEYEDERYGGQITAWKENGKWVKILNDIYDDHGPLSGTYYLQDGKLFFQFHRSEFVEMLEKPSTQINETRSYLYDGLLIQKLDKSHVFKFGEKVDISKVKNDEIKLSSADAKSEFETLHKDVEQLLEMLEKQIIGN